MHQMPRMEEHEKMRQAWIADGMRWHAANPPAPEGWGPIAQLERVRQARMEQAAEEQAQRDIQRFERVQYSEVVSILKRSGGIRPFQNRGRWREALHAG
jgi:hypothetical protein